ncbi:MAG: hypothetical protein WBV82_23445 [Myxococcaceae bacterium]
MSPSQPGPRKAVSAARQAPLPKEAPQGPLSARLKEGASESALNVAGLLRDLWDDFRNSDRYFKYKALVLGTWLLLSSAGVFVACPGSTGPENTIGARLTLVKVVDDEVITLFNESGDDWEEVMVVVNKRYGAAVPRVSHAAPENTFTVDRRKLLGDQGQPAPADLRITDIEVRTSDGRATLMADGRLLE